jgi:hypothetical protein
VLKKWRTLNPIEAGTMPEVSETTPSSATDACRLIDLPDGVLLQILEALSPRQVCGLSKPDDKATTRTNGFMHNDADSSCRVSVQIIP